MDSEPLVSVVTPVYNTGEYLEQAICSVRAQSYRNWEYIICNNHSTDNSGEIAARYARQDARIKVVKPPQFLPQAENYNFALQQLSPGSRYCKMILADDKLFPNCLREMVALAETKPSIAIVSAYRLIEADGDCFGLPHDQPVIPGRVAARLHLLNRLFLFGGPSTVLYRSDIVRARSPRFFPEDRFYFDTEAVLQILGDQDFGFVHQVLTFTRFQAGSITDSVSRYCWRDLDRIIGLQTYGKAYLSREEYERSMSLAWRVYYERLGHQWLSERFGSTCEAFWDFHKKGLSSIGLRIEPRRLAFGVGYAFLRAVGSPFDLVRNIVRSRRPTEDPWRT